MYGDKVGLVAVFVAEVGVGFFKREEGVEE